MNQHLAPIMNRRPLTAGRHNSRQRLPKPQTVSETPQNKQTPMRRDLIAAPCHPHITSTATIHLGDAPSSGSDTCRDTRIIPHRRGFSANANPLNAKTRERSGLEDADAVELPYQGGELAMWLIVPHNPAGLAAVEESLDASALTTLYSAARMGPVDLTMPKWEQTLPPTDLFAWLCPLGFCPGAGFDGIAGDIVITAALHGAKVIVDENGTEAAAATAIAFAESMPPEPDLTIVADRPFLWAIVHQDTGALLFVGRLVDPTA